MATKKLTGAPERADHQATAALPQLAADALHRLERAFPQAFAEQRRIERIVAGLKDGESAVINGTQVTAVSLAVAEAVTRYEVAAARYDELMARPASTLSPKEFDAIGFAQQTMADAFGALAEAGRTDLLTPLEVADRYQAAAARCARLAAQNDIDGCWAAQDEMRMCVCQLKDAGRLDLIKVAS